MELVTPVLLAILALGFMIGQFFREGNTGFWIAAASGILAIVHLYLIGRGDVAPLVAVLVTIAVALGVAKKN